MTVRVGILTLIISISICLAGYSQVVVEKSTEKVIISGVQYYIHQVKKGETAYSISKAYGITVEELIRENPQAVYGVKDGQSLSIPVKTEPVKQEPTSLTNKQKDESRFVYHQLKSGETIYSLSKSYGVSENDIIQANTGIDINKLSIGTEIAIPKKDFINNRQKFEDGSKNYVFHKVVKGETMTSIAKQYGMTLRELRKENKETKFPQVGDYIRIPSSGAAESEKIVEVKPDSSIVKQENPVSETLKPVGYTPVNNLKGSIDVAVLLPFYLKENSERVDIDSSKSLKGKRIYSVDERPEEWIYPMGYDFIEMYNGILLAADTLRSLGLNINISSFDIKSDTIGITKLITSGKLENMDLIIGPVYSHNLIKIANYAKKHGIPVVSPVPLLNNSSLKNNPTLFLANSSLEVAQEAIAKKMREYSDNNIVFIHNDTTGTDEDVQRFKKLILNELSQRVPYDEIRFKEMMFYGRSMFDNDSINRLSHSLSENKGNVVIIASEEPPVISETIQNLHALSKKFDIKILGYPELRDIDNLDPKYLFDMNILVYSPYWIDYSQKDVKIFNSHYRQKFLTEPSGLSYAWQGYDIMYYFISGLAKFGKEFVSNPSIHFPDLLQTEFDFVRNKAGDGFENQKLFPVRYTKDYDVILDTKDEDQ
jgi:LysM repeat protein